MELITTIINSILILVVLIYQIQKNKTLQDKINNQEKIIIQTNDIVVYR